MAGYVLAADAESNLEAVWNYGCDTWGPDQADRYLDLLDACSERIAAANP